MVYAVPEIKDKGEALREKCTRWKSEVKEICKQLEPRVALEEDSGGVDGDTQGGHYSLEMTVKRHALATRIHDFLGYRNRGKKRWWKKWQSYNKGWTDSINLQRTGQLQGHMHPAGMGSRHEKGPHRRW